MRRAFAILGLKSDASLIEIKKAYARLLKQTRPEDDAVGFQRLQDAFEACIGFAKHRQAQAEARERQGVLVAAGDDPNQYDDEAFDEGEGNVPQEVYRSAVPVRSRIVPVALPPPLTPRSSTTNLEPAPSLHPRAPALSVDELHRLLVEIVAAGERLSAFKLRQWLHSHDALVSLDVQRLVAGALPAFILEGKPRLDTERLRVLFEYFIGAEYNPAHADPRLRMAWEQVHAEELFQREMASLRRRHHTRIDRMLFEELLGAPQAWRRRLLLALPTIPGRIRSLLAAIRAISPHRSAQELQPEAVEFWDALTAPGRLPWRLVALAHAQLSVVIALAVISIGLLVGLEPREMPTLVLVGVVQASAVWFALKGLAILGHHNGVRRARKIAAGHKPRDSMLTISYVLSAVALAFAVVQIFSSAGEGAVVAAASCATLVVLLLLLSGRGRRWEMLLVAGIGAAAVGRMLAVAFGAFMTGPAIAAVSFGFGSLLAVLADEWHARHEKLEPPRARGEINHIALKLSAACFVVLFLGLSFGYVPENAALQQEISARQAQEAEVRDRVQQAVEKLREEATPWRQWARANAVTVRPEFSDVDEAFQTLVQAVTPIEPIDTPFRAFRVSDGPLAGDWVFSDGNRSRPDLMVHYPPAEGEDERKAGQILCRNNNRACRTFRKEASIAPESLERVRSPGGRLTFDSPGLPAARFTCPAAQLQPHEFSLLTSVPVAVLFNGAGSVVEVRVRGASGNAGAESAVISAALRCSIVATNGEPGILETSIFPRH